MTALAFPYPADSWLGGCTATTLDSDAVRRASFGLPFHQGQPLDSPARELPAPHNQQVAQLLQQQWQVATGADAEELTEKILTEGMHYQIFDPYLALLHEGGNPAAFEGFLQQHYTKIGVEVQPWLEHFHQWQVLLHSPEFRSVAPLVLPQTTIAWDILRVELIAGRAVGAGLLSPEQGWDYAGRAVAQLQHHFASWQQMAVSFWWGRAIWLADQAVDAATLSLFDQVFSTALLHPHSPWVRVPLHDNSLLS